MSNDEPVGPLDENSVDENTAAVSANIHVHPATAKATAALVAALQQEIRGWMADEIEELAEYLEESGDCDATSDNGGPTAADVHALSDQLAKQAEMLGYPKIVEIAERLKLYFDSGLLDAPQSPTRVEEQLAELRAAIAS